MNNFASKKACVIHLSNAIFWGTSHKLLEMEHIWNVYLTF